MRSVIANFRPHEFWYGVKSPSPAFRQVQQTAALFGVKAQPRVTGDSFDYGGVHIRVLNPAAGAPANDPPQDDEAPQADLLKVDDHGSATSSSPEFLAAVQPRYAVVSVGFYTSFHHPRPDVMRRYADAHVETYRTDLAGAVSFYLDGKTVSATPVPR